MRSRGKNRIRVRDRRARQPPNSKTKKYSVAVNSVTAESSINNTFRRKYTKNNSGGHSEYIDIFVSVEVGVRAKIGSEIEGRKSTNYFIAESLQEEA